MDRCLQEGLPKGELGRMGLAIARGIQTMFMPLVESKKNAIIGPPMVVIPGRNEGR